jgi:tetratricopeptide (TPR) repeat protein
MKSGLLSDLGQYERALEAAHYLIDFVDKLDSERVWADVFTFIAWLHINLGQLDKAQGILLQALPRAESSNEPTILIETLMVLGELSLHQGELENFNTGLLYVQRALALCNQTSYTPNQVAVLSLATSLCLQLSQPKQALVYSSEAIQISSKIASAYQSEIYLYSHAQALLANNQIAAAQDYLQRARSRVLQVAEQTQDAASRQSWLENVPVNRAILHDYDFPGK